MVKKWLAPIATFLGLAAGCVLIWLYFYSPSRKILQLDAQPADFTAYYQPFSDDEIKTAENGSMYVDSQILVTADFNASKAEMEALFSSIGAKIVGYLEISEDYQILFEQPKTYEELTRIAEDLCQNPLVTRAAVHKVLEMSTDAQPQELPNTSQVFDGDNWFYNSPRVKNPAIPSGATWWAEAVNLPNAWEIAGSCPGGLAPVSVGVYDSVFDTTVPNELSFTTQPFHNPSTIYSLFSQEEIQENIDEIHHGTHVAGLIAAKMNNHLGIRGASSATANSHVDLYGFSYIGATNMQSISFSEDEDLLVNGYHSSQFIAKYGFSQLLIAGAKITNRLIINRSMGPASKYTVSACYDDKVLHLTSSHALDELRYSRDDLQEFIMRCEARGFDFLIINSAGNDNGIYYNLTGTSAASGLTVEEWNNNYLERHFIVNDVSVFYTPLGSIDKSHPAAKHILIVGSVDLNYSLQQDGNGTPYSDGGRWYAESSFSNKFADIYAPGGTMTATYPNGSTDKHKILSLVGGRRYG